MANSLSSLASAMVPTLTTKKSYALIYALNADDTLNNSLGPLKFQYFPETITDTKGINWSPKDIPGGSLPLYQWVSSGARTISFVAQFSTDVDCSKPTPQVSEVAATVESPNLDISKYKRLRDQGLEDRNVDIRAAVAWLRSYMLPSYGNTNAVGVAKTTAPSKLRLSLPNSGIGLAGGSHSASSRDWMTCVMAGCDVTWTAFFPSGVPRLASVQLSLNQVAQYNGMVDFPQVGATMTQEIGTEGVNTFGYNLRPK